MDPVTGLSRREGIALLVIVALGVVVSTVATVGSSGPQEGCAADPRYGCIEYPPGEPVRIGLLVADPLAEADAAAETVSVAVEGATVAGRRVEVETRAGDCSIGEASEHSRELRSDTPDEPPAFAVIAVACPEALLPAAQILDDAGVLVAAATAPPDTGVDLAVTGDADLDSLARRLVEAAEAVATTPEDDTLIAPRSLREHLLANGMVPA